MLPIVKISHLQCSRAMFHMMSDGQKSDLHEFIPYTQSTRHWHGEHAVGYVISLSRLGYHDSDTMHCAVLSRGWFDLVDILDFEMQKWP